MLCVFATKYITQDLELPNLCCYYFLAVVADNNISNGWHTLYNHGTVSAAVQQQGMIIVCIGGWQLPGLHRLHAVHGLYR
jgi:hypothetical protein